jgi:Cu/Ag efflux protein CusF
MRAPMRAGRIPRVPSRTLRGTLTSAGQRRNGRERPWQNVPGLNTPPLERGSNGDLTEMRILVFSLGLAAALGASLALAAQAAAADSAPAKVTAARALHVTATIVGIDKDTRDVTLKGPKGNELTMMADPEVTNYDKLKVGDRVDARYVQATMVELVSGGGRSVSRTVQAGAAGHGARPGGTAGRTVTVVADVVGLDPDTQTVTLKGPQRTVDVTVSDPALFQRIKQGDQVKATYAQALAIAVEPAVKVKK